MAADIGREEKLIGWRGEVDLEDSSRGRSTSNGEELMVGD